MSQKKKQRGRRVALRKCNLESFDASLDSKSNVTIRDR